MNSFYIQYFVVSSKDILESMEFSDIQRKFYQKICLFKFVLKGHPMSQHTVLICIM